MLTTKPNQNRQLFLNVARNSLVQTDQNMITQNGNRTANAERPCAASADTAPSTTPTGCDAVADLDTMRPEVREAVLYYDQPLDDPDPHWDIIRAELLRLAQLAADWRTKAAVFESERDVARSMHGQRDEELQCAIVDRERAEAERDALRKRIDESRHVTIGSYPAHGFGYVQMICDPAKGISDKVYALVPLDDAEAAP